MVATSGIILISALIISKTWQSVSADIQQKLLNSANVTIDSDGYVVDSTGKDVTNMYNDAPDLPSHEGKHQVLIQIQTEQIPTHGHVLQLKES
jgi:hypothetical protein